MLDLTNDFLIVPFHDHMRVFYMGDFLCEVDSYREAYIELNEAFERDGKERPFPQIK